MQARGGAWAVCGEEAGLVRCPRGGRVVPGQPAGTVLSVGEWVLRERFATDAGEIAWDRLGKGPPVVLVHGTPWSSWTWRRVAPRLAERFTVYRVRPARLWRLRPTPGTRRLARRARGSPRRT